MAAGIGSGAWRTEGKLRKPIPGPLGTEKQAPRRLTVLLWGIIVHTLRMEAGTFRCEAVLGIRAHSPERWPEPLGPIWAPWIGDLFPVQGGTGYVKLICLSVRFSRFFTPHVLNWPKKQHRNKTISFLSMRLVTLHCLLLQNIC